MRKAGEWGRPVLLAAVLGLAGAGPVTASEVAIWLGEEPAVVMPPVAPMPGPGQGIKVAGAPGDRALAGQVALALERTLHLAPFGVVVSADGAAITLAGTVPTEFTRSLATDVAARVPGVEAVSNRLFISEYPATPGVGDPVDAQYHKFNRIARDRLFYEDYLQAPWPGTPGS